MEGPLTQDQQVKAFLYRKKRENGNERFRLAKAIQWYFFYGAMTTTGIFLIHNYPKVLDIFSSIESYVIVIVFYILMYGIVFVAYMTTPWPYPLLFKQSSQIKAMNWSPQLVWIERLLTITYYGFYILGNMIDYIRKDQRGAVILFVLQLPHIFTSLFGFPIRAPAQVGAIVIRFFALFFSICHLHISFIFFHRIQTLAISGVLGAVPFALLVGMYFNGRVDKRPIAFIFGKRRRDLVIMTVTGISFVLWEGLLCFMVFYYNTPAFGFPEFFWVPLKHPFDDLIPFLEASVVCCMAVLSIPTLYHSFLKVEEVYPQKIYEEAEETTRLIDMSVPKSAPNNFMDHIALVIACHKSKDNIIKTLEAAHKLANFPKKNIYIAHNAGTPEPIDPTGETVWAIEEWKDVHYIYIPVGNKSIAMNYVLENYVQPDGIPLTVMIDDDVLFPEDIDLKGGYEQIMNDDKVKAVAFTIKGIDDSNLWQKFQHLEYMQAGLLKMFQGKFGSVLTCHGAIALWDVKACIDVFAEHNTEFHGEDLQMGLILRKMNQEFRIEANAVGPVATASPKSLLYETDANEKSLFSQRVFSWDMAAHHFFMDFLRLTFLNWEKCGLILKPFMLIEIWTMIQDWLRFLFLASIFQEDPIKAISLIILLVVLQMVIVLIFDKLILSHRPELQSSTYICMLYPLYNITTVLFRFVGLLYNSLYYTPWNPPRILIKDRKRLGMIPPGVVEPRGTLEERKDFWYSVWKLQTYENKGNLGPQLADALVAAAAVVLKDQPELAPSVVVDVDGETPGEPQDDNNEEISEEDDIKEEVMTRGAPDLESNDSQIFQLDYGVPQKVSTINLERRTSALRFPNPESSPELTPRGGNRVRWADTESCESVGMADKIKIDANFNKRMSVRVSS